MLVPRDTALLLDVWRHACLQHDLRAATRAVADNLRARLGLSALAIYALEGEGPTPPALRLVAQAGADGAEALAPSLAAGAALQGLLNGGHLLTGPLATVAMQVPGLIRTPAGAGPGRRLAIVALAMPSRPLGIAVLLYQPPELGEAGNQKLIDGLREPLTAALDSHVRHAEHQRFRAAAEADNRSLLRRLGRSDLAEPVVGAESGLASVMRRVALVAASDAPVLLLGETGTGKEVIAREIHRRSRRADGPFLRLNCGAIPPDLIDSELFGHEVGSFTGALAQRQGWFERADAGTLLLDEVGELPHQAQVRLLRVLQDGSYQRVGGQNTLHADVRILAATHRDLPGMVKQGSFREDLWYRLAVFPVEIPPLRQRLSDIPALASHFAAKSANRLGLRCCLPTSDDLRLLMEYPWPGNLRELAAVIERGAILGDGQRLDIATALGGGGSQIAPGGLSAPSAPHSATPLPPGCAQVRTGASAAITVQSLDAAMRQHIEEALRHSLGRIEGPFGAARRLGINPHTLRARMRKLGIDWRAFRQA